MCKLCQTLSSFDIGKTPIRGQEDRRYDFRTIHGTYTKCRDIDRLTFADRLALVLLRGRARAVGASPAGRRAVAEALPPLAAGAAPLPHPGGAALRPLRPRRPAAGHCGLRKEGQIL